MTNHVHRLLWVLPNSKENQTFLQRLGVAVHAEGYSNSWRFQVINGKLPIDLEDPESDNWQTLYSAASNGASPDYFVGSGSLTSGEWARVQSRIPFAPEGLRYLRLSLDDSEEFEVAETNWPELMHTLGRPCSESQLLALAGLRPYRKSPTNSLEAPAT